MSEYKVMVGRNEMFRFEMDPANATAPILLDGDATPFQTATVSHDPETAAEAINGWMESQGGGYWEEGDDFRVVEIEQEWEEEDAGHC